MELTENKPIISVVIPIYNSESTIGICVESIISQTFADIEIVLVDDGSSDRSGKICDEYAHQDQGTFRSSCSRNTPCTWGMGLLC